MKHLQPVSETFTQKGEPLKSLYRVDGKLYNIRMQSYGTGRPHDPFAREPLIEGCVAGTDPVYPVEVEKGETIRIHYHSREGVHCRLDWEV